MYDKCPLTWHNGFCLLGLGDLPLLAAELSSQPRRAGQIAGGKTRTPLSVSVTVTMPGLTIRPGRGHELAAGRRRLDDDWRRLRAVYMTVPA